MNQRLRLDYLDAMGIVQYAARFPLPNALPSLTYDFSEAENEVQTDISQPIITPMQDSIRKILQENSPPAITKKTTDNIQQTIQKKPTPKSVSDNTLFHCQTALWAVDDLLVLAEISRLDNAQLTLLRNILNAIGRTDQLSATHQFAWPLSQHRDKSLPAARDHFQGMIDGGVLKNRAVRQILCFGQQANTLLAQHDAQHDAQNLTMQQYREWPIVTTCTLQDMLDQPAKKADTWRTLQVLVRH